jgi:hypothetical protein
MPRKNRKAGFFNPAFPTHSTTRTKFFPAEPQRTTVNTTTSYRNPDFLPVTSTGDKGA